MGANDEERSKEVKRENYEPEELLLDDRAERRERKYK